MSNWRVVLGSLQFDRKKIGLRVEGVDMSESKFSPSGPWVAAWYRDGKPGLQIAIGNGAGTLDLLAASKALDIEGDDAYANGEREAHPGGGEVTIGDLPPFGPNDVAMLVEVTDGVPEIDVHICRSASCAQLWEASAVIGLMAKAEYTRHFAERQMREQQDMRLRSQIISNKH